jgi:hypothetical protein
VSLPLALKATSFHVRLLRTRLPFRYGAVTLTHFPLLHLAVEVEAADGRRAGGFAADNLPPKWFDKDPRKSFRDNVEDQLAAIRAADAAYLDAARTPRPLFEIWQEAYAASRAAGCARGLNGLTASFGSSFFERALADAAGRLAGLDVVGMLRANTLGLRPEAAHRDLSFADLERWARAIPPDRLAVRHTVGLLDPITAADVPATGWLHDGLPQTLEECVRRHGLTHFRSKVSGSLDADSTASWPLPPSSTASWPGRTSSRSTATSSTRPWTTSPIWWTPCRARQRWHGWSAPSRSSSSRSSARSPSIPPRQRAWPRWGAASRCSSTRATAIWTPYQPRSRSAIGACPPSTARAS